eukprot:SAG25_NODE_67_length_17436_cov_89.239257_1_plen_254_part_00
MYNNRRNRLAESFPSMYGSRGRRQDLGGLVVSLPVLAENWQNWQTGRTPSRFVWQLKPYFVRDPSARACLCPTCHVTGLYQDCYAQMLAAVVQGTNTCACDFCVFHKSTHALGTCPPTSQAAAAAVDRDWGRRRRRRAPTPCAGKIELTPHSSRRHTLLTLPQPRTPRSPRSSSYARTEGAMGRGGGLAARKPRLPSAAATATATGWTAGGKALREDQQLARITESQSACTVLYTPAKFSRGSWAATPFSVPS